MPDALVAPSGRDLTRSYMMSELTARGTSVPWTSSVPENRPERFCTIEELNSSSAEFGVIAESQLLAIRYYDRDEKRLGQTCRLIKGLWLVMPNELEVQSVEHAGGPSYDEDRDVPGLLYGQVTAWVTVMNALA